MIWLAVKTPKQLQQLFRQALDTINYRVITTKNISDIFSGLLIQSE